MAYHIYWGSGSPFAWRVLLGLEIKGLEYKSHLLQMSKGDHKKPEYLAMNPRGKVPVLRDGDTVIHESIAILAYLDRKHPELPLFGSEPGQTGSIWQFILELENYLREPMFTIVLPLFFGEEIKDIDAIKESEKLIHEEFKRFENILSTSAYLAGDKVSAADVAFFPMLQVLLRAATKDAAAPLGLKFIPLDKNYPNLASWVKRIEVLPGYDNTYPTHWRE